MAEELVDEERVSMEEDTTGHPYPAPSMSPLSTTILHDLLEEGEIPPLRVETSAGPSRAQQ